MIAKAIANECDATFFSISPSTVQSKWIGESAKLVKTTFAIARYLAKIKNSGSIVFFDEIDSLLGKRVSDGSDKTATLKTQFLMEFQGVATNNDDGHALIIGATNFPDAIDEAARRRLEKLIYVPLPNKNGRKQLFMNLLKKANDKKPNAHTLEENDIEILADKTDGYSGSDIWAVVKEAAVGPLREAMRHKANNKNNRDYKRQSLRPLTFQDFERALREKRPTVTEDQVLKHEKWNSKFCG